MCYIGSLLRNLGWKYLYNFSFIILRILVPYRSILHAKCLIVMQCVVYFYLVFKAFDRDSDSFVNMEEWIRGLSVFLRGTLDEHLKCMFFLHFLYLSFYGSFS